MFPSRVLAVSPAEGASGPRLWVRRLVIWRERGVILRDIEFRPGLNIIWSPDPADGGDRLHDHETVLGPGHGAGKTLLCRLIRYCLGEPRFAEGVQRAKIAGALPDGAVGAEVILDGEVWTVMRAIGSGRRDVVQKGTSLDDAQILDAPATGMKPLADGIVECILSAEVADLISGDRVRAWLTALAWLTRDQECRFSRLTDWRAAASDSGSPARQLSAGAATDAIRALLGAITPKEHELVREVLSLDKQLAAAQAELERQRWLLAKSTSQIAKLLGTSEAELPNGPLLVGSLRAKARTLVSDAAVVDGRSETEPLRDLEANHERARDILSRVERDMAVANGDLKAALAVAERIEAETPGLSASLDDAEAPVCPVCEVPIDRALAEGCGLSDKLPDVQTLRARRENNQRELRVQRDRAAKARALLAGLEHELREAKYEVGALRKQIGAARSLQDERREVWYTSRRAGELITEVEQLMGSVSDAENSVGAIDAELAAKRELVARARKTHDAVFAHLEAHFDPIIRELLGGSASGRIRLDGKGLHLSVECGGERSTPAIDSAKIIAWDIAAMCRSMEPGAHIPALLLHDSPREADLGLSVYHQLFALVRTLEELGPHPLFQYIVTTTTRPPDDLCTDPWLRLELRGLPSEERLFRRDL